MRGKWSRTDPLMLILLPRAVLLVFIELLIVFFVSMATEVEDDGPEGGAG